MFPILSEIVVDSGPPDCIETILAYMHNSEGEISQRFDKIKYAGSLAWVIDPFLARPEDVSYLSNAAEEELIGLQTNSQAKEIHNAKNNDLTTLNETELIRRAITNSILQFVSLPALKVWPSL